MQIPVAGMLAERPRHQRLRDPGRQRQRGRGIAGSRALLQRRHQLQARIAMEFLGDRQIVQQRVVSAAIACTRPRLRGVDEVAPVIGAATRPQQELIDTMRCGPGILGHVISPGSFVGVWSTMVRSRPCPLIQVNGSQCRDPLAALRRLPGTAAAPVNGRLPERSGSTPASVRS